MERWWAEVSLRAMDGWQLREKNGGGRRKQVERAVELQLHGKDLVSMVLEVMAYV